MAMISPSTPETQPFSSRRGRGLTMGRERGSSECRCHIIRLTFSLQWKPLHFTNDKMKDVDDAEREHLRKYCECS